MAAKKLFLIDGHALLYRSFYAIKELVTSTGQPTNAVYGFIHTLRKILREQNPDYLAVCFDSKEKTHRQDKFAEYKIQRPMMPEGLISQIPLVKDVLKAYNVATFEEPGYEADDIIATLVKKVAKDALEITIVSDDKDMYQLAKKGIRFYSARKDEVYDEKALAKTLGFKPQQIIDFIGLAGDKTDNIPGVTGVGEVTARNLLNQFGSLENVYKNLNRIDQVKIQEKLQAQRDNAYLSKELALLESDTPIQYKLSDLKVRSPDEKRLFAIFRSLEFRRLAEEFSFEESEEKDLSVKNVSSVKDAKALLERILEAKQFAFLPSAQGDATLFESGGITISTDGKTIFQVEPKGLSAFAKAFSDKKILKITYDLKSALKELEANGIKLDKNIFDVKLASYLAGLSYSSSTPSDLAWRYLKQSIADTNRRAQEVAALSDLYAILSKELTKRDLTKLHDNLEIPLSIVLYKMEQQGVKIDLKLLASLSKECARSIGNLEKKIFKLAGEEFNLNSPKQLSRILFEILRLPVIKRTKTGFSTDEGVLTKLSQEHEVASLILKYRLLAKLKSTYIDALPKMVDATDGRIHAEFDQVGAETGRFASRNPNLQNIPIRTELGREIRKAFIPSKKRNILISADYSQIELRILAHLSQDKTLIRTFEAQKDIHNLTASLIFDVKEDEVDYGMRDTAKRVNFGIIYGMSAFGLAKDLNISTTEAQTFIDTYFARYPKVKDFVERAIKDCEKNGYAMTILNRRRYIPEINSKNHGIKQFAQRQAINTPVQGSAADLMKLAMINVQKEMEKKNLVSKMIMTVHDELVFDATKKEDGELIALVRKQMEEPMKLSVPIKVSVKAGPNWLEMKEI